MTVPKAVLDSIVYVLVHPVSLGLNPTKGEKLRCPLEQGLSGSDEGKIVPHALARLQAQWAAQSSF